MKNTIGHIIEIANPNDVKQKGHPLNECCVSCVISTSTSPMTLTLDFKGQILKIAVSWEREGRLTWDERDVSPEDVGPTMWLWAMTLTLDF